MLDGSWLACDSGGPVFRLSAIVGSVIRLAVAVALCLGAATQDVFTQSALWLAGLATGQAAADEGYFHSHGAGGVAHWHPWDSEPVAKPPSGEAGYAPASDVVHDHAVSPSILGAVATFDFATLDVLCPVVESGRFATQIDGHSSLWLVMRPRGPPVV